MIIEEYNTRNIYEIKGVFKRMPLIAIASILAIFGITGAPLFNGSISKYLIQSGAKGTLMEYGIILVNFGTIISFIKYSSMFFNDKNKKSTENKVKKNKKIKTNRTLIVLVLGMVCFLGGILGEQIVYILFNQKIHISVEAYYHKAQIYFVSLIGGYLVYKFIILRWHLLHKVREIELSFNYICLSIVSFFFFMTIIMNLTI